LKSISTMFPSAFLILSVRNKDIVSSQKCREPNNDSRAAESIVEQQLSGDMKMSPQSGNSGQSGQQQPQQPQQQQQQQQQLTIQQQNINSHQLPQHNQQPMYQPVYMAQGPNGSVYQMMPQTLGSNVYVSNVTANVNLHGYVPATHPQHVMAPAYLASTDQSQNVTPGTAGAIMHENHNNNVRANGGNSGRRVRSSNSGRNNGNNSGMNRRMDYQPNNNNNNNRGHPSNQQEMMQHQPQAMMEPQPVASYPQYYTIPYHNPHHGAPTFYAAPPPHMAGHPSAQHATGTPLYIAASPMPMHGYPQMYYPQGVMYQPIIQPQEYQPIVDPEEKGEQHDGGNQQQIAWQGQAQIVEYNDQPPQQQQGVQHDQNDQEYQSQVRKCSMFLLISMNKVPSF
jgi:ubiquitin carboxyl-terminal hydrolase 10